ncbi:hypothetical protein [Acetobacter sp. KSO5]|uniref:hypothetical protein n=1 Tax=Acetobacter sp. KSO5 TaxID=3373674 RepID=UPI00376F09E0
MKKSTSMPKMTQGEGIPSDCIREQMLIQTRQWCLERVRFKASYTDDELKASVESAKILEEYLLSGMSNHKRTFINYSCYLFQKIKNIISVCYNPIFSVCFPFCCGNSQRHFPDKAFTRERGIGNHKESSFCCCGKHKMDDVGGCGNVAAQQNDAPVIETLKGQTGPSGFNILSDEREAEIRAFASYKSPKSSSSLLRRVMSGIVHILDRCRPL